MSLKSRIAAIFAGKGLSHQQKIGQAITDASWLRACSVSYEPIEPEIQQHQPSCHPDTTPQISHIYSGIGVGVYQGKATVFRLMAIGERRWIGSKLQPNDLNQLPFSSPHLLHCLAYILDLYHEQPDLVKMDLQTRDGIELAQYYCQHLQSGNKSGISEASENNPLIEKSQSLTQLQLPKYLKPCPYWEQCNTRNTENQPFYTHERKENDRPDEPTAKN